LPPLFGERGQAPLPDLLISNSSVSSKISMLKVPNTREHHCQAVFVGGRYDFVVAD
jgi:hypothetical protein